MASEMRQKFVSEQISPVPGTGRAGAMARGEPGLPERFTWRGTEYRVVGVTRQWKSSGPCKSGGGEVYLRRHWFQVVTEPRAVMRIYCERQARSRSRAKARWFLYTIEQQ